MAGAVIELPVAIARSGSGVRPRRTGASTVGEALRELAETEPALGAQLFAAPGRLRRSFVLLVNGVDVRNLEGERTELHEGDRLAVVAALSGG